MHNPEIGTYNTAPELQDTYQPMSDARKKAILDALEAKVGHKRGMGIVGQLRYNYYIDDYKLAQRMTDEAIESFVEEYGLEIGEEA